MPLNENKIFSIILEECDGIEERCKGYRDRIRKVTVEVLQDERAHRVSATNIQKKINDKCNAAAQFLTSHRGQDARTEESDS